MSKADDYNRAEYAAGRLTIAHITELVRWFQHGAGITEDGMCGKDTRAELESNAHKLSGATPSLVLYSPMPVLADGRKAQITSEFRPADRPNHDGVDFFYRWKAGDKPDFVGDKGCAGTIDGHPKWVVPYETQALAANDGKVQLAGNSPTGYRVWIDHGNGYRTGYFHLLDMRVREGDRVVRGQPLGSVGDNPKDHDGRHLHFELSPVDRYAPMDPTPYLRL